MPLFTLSDGQELYYETRGEGPPLVFVPGLGGVAGFWEKVAPTLAQHFTVILHDHRGCGRSSHVPGRFSVDQMADDLYQLLQFLGIERAAFLGHSTGGAIAQTLAITQPGLVERMVLSATWCGPEAYVTNLFSNRKAVLMAGGLGLYQKTSAFFLRPPGYWHDHGPELDALGANATHDAVEVEILAARLDALIAFDRRSQLGTITQPTLAICARDDMVTPPALSQEIVAGIDGATFIELSYGGHFTPLVVPAAFLDASLPFLRP